MSAHVLGTAHFDFLCAAVERFTRPQDDFLASLLDPEALDLEVEAGTARRSYTGHGFTWTW